MRDPAWWRDEIKTHLSFRCVTHSLISQVLLWWVILIKKDKNTFLKRWILNVSERLNICIVVSEGQQGTFTYPYFSLSPIETYCFHMRIYFSTNVKANLMKCNASLNVLSDIIGIHLNNIKGNTMISKVLSGITHRSSVQSFRTFCTLFLVFSHLDGTIWN